MATDTIIRIKRNPYHGYEVWLWANGELTRRSFDNTIDLVSKLAADCVSDRDIEMACDQFERLEWEEPEYPLGVSWVGEWVSDLVIPNAVVLSPVRPKPPKKKPPGMFWEWAAATLRIGAVIAPWVLLMLAGRWVWGVMS